jgi:uncharacterized membrane protein
MSSLERALARWREAGLLDAGTAGRIRAFERTQTGSQGKRWTIWLALGLGALLVGAGLLLFVEANWDEISPNARFALVVSLVASLHVCAALARDRFAALGTAVHAVGTAALGAGIFLSAQIFHLAEHWPGGFLLWAIGAAAAFALLREWPQGVFLALLAPIWLVGEWVEATRGSEANIVASAGLTVLALVYLGARDAESTGALRRALGWIGALTVIPVSASLGFVSRGSASASLLWLGWILALGLPLALAWLLRGRHAWPIALGAGLALLLAHSGRDGSPALLAPRWVAYLLYALGSVGLMAWGVYEARAERINLGTACFVITVIAFYFDNVFDKLGRAASLAGLGVLLLVLGAVLERTRRGLLARMQRATA